jgi:hypothetical protein
MFLCGMVEIGFGQRIVRLEKQKRPGAEAPGLFKAVPQFGGGAAER